jgi:hypothetical protein
VTIGEVGIWSGILVACGGSTGNSIVPGWSIPVTNMKRFKWRDTWKWNVHEDIISKNREKTEQSIKGEDPAGDCYETGHIPDTNLVTPLSSGNMEIAGVENMCLWLWTPYLEPSWLLRIEEQCQERNATRQHGTLKRQ